MTRANSERQSVSSPDTRRVLVLEPCRSQEMGAVTVDGDYSTGRGCLTEAGGTRLGLQFTLYDLSSHRRVVRLHNLAG